MEPLNFRHEGRTIRGTLHLPERGDAPGVVLCHGFSGNRTEFGHTYVRLGRRLAERGIAAYRFDFAGGGDSDGEYGDITVSDQVSQTLAALDALGQVPGVDKDRLSLLGMSLGGLTASLAATENPVRTLALWAPAALAVEANEPDEVEYWPEIVEKGYDDLFGQPVTRRFTEDGFGIDSWTKAAAFTGPVLLAAGTEDELFPDDVIDHYREIYADRLELHLFEDLDHCFETVPARAALVDLTAEFLLRTM